MTPDRNEPGIVAGASYFEATVLRQRQEAALWAELQCGNLQARAQLIDCYLPFARVVAARLYANRPERSLEFDDYMQSATLGLLHAIDHYRPDESALFKTYAYHCIKGEILNAVSHMTERGWQVNAYKRLQQSRCASLVSEETNVQDELFQHLADIAISLAYGFLIEKDEKSNQQHGAYCQMFDSLELEQLRKRLVVLVKSLPRVEYTVIQYHYFNAIPFETIADMLSLSKGRISQIHRQALMRLRQEVSTLPYGELAW